MRCVFGLLASAALLFGSGEFSGRRAPGFSLPDLHLQQHDLADYRGKIVVIDIIQTTCPHCQETASMLTRIMADFPAKDLQVVGVAINDATIATWHAKYQYNRARPTANRRSVGTSIATVSEEAGDILSGDTVESRSERLFQSLDGARADPPQIGFHPGPGGLDRAEVGTVGRQIAIGEA